MCFFFQQPTEPEDEETKKYRLEIEKQKSMREKILRDKEMRRRQAAEDKTKDEVSRNCYSDSHLHTPQHFQVPVSEFEEKKSESLQKGVIHF